MIGFFAVGIGDDELEVEVEAADPCVLRAGDKARALVDMHLVHIRCMLNNIIFNVVLEYVQAISMNNNNCL
jgi:hypothetical protein